MSTHNMFLSRNKELVSGYTRLSGLNDKINNPDVNKL